MDGEVCEQCETGFELRGGVCVVVEEEVSEEKEEEAPAGSVVVGNMLTAASVATAVAASVSSGSSINSCYSVINLFQLYVLLPLLPGFFPKELEKLIIGLNFSILSFNFVSIFDVQEDKILKSWMDLPQSNQYLKEVGLKSDSAFISHFPYFANL